LTTDVSENEQQAPAAQPAQEFAPPQAPAPYQDAAPARTEDRPSAPFRRPGGGGGGGGGRGRFGRRKVCAYCVDKIDHIDYKEAHKLRRFLSERGKIEPRRKTGTCARHQRKLTLAIKRARHIALLPYTAGHNFN
jgi:small subunit ribosomal protein S18